MSRDHRNLRVFILADELAVQIYRATRHFPADEQFGLRGQLRRSAVGAANAIVEGSARRTTAEYVQFLNLANGSAAEASYLLGLSQRLGYVTAAVSDELAGRYEELRRGLQSMMKRFEPEIVSRSRRA
jgi:four helix bundle protein